ncbi:MAG: hypothetical protein JWL77_5364 [Chthonomonadaceae bacterium]|nr:hypothetical protein [Chthonomonadaceae bacterium]
MKTRFGSTRQGKVYILLSVLLLCVAGYGASAKHKQDTTPIFTTSTDTADPNLNGNIDAAVTQTQQLLTALQAVNYDPTQLPDMNLAILPDASMSDDETFRNPDCLSYSFPTEPELSQIACYSEIYARQNMSMYTGDQSTSAPSGFYIVAWKNGTVQKVAVADVREIPCAADGSGVPCFPGMTGYDPALPNFMK